MAISTKLNQNELETDFEPMLVRYSFSKRYFILALISFAGLLAPLASTIYFPSDKNIISELNTTGQLFDVTISVFMSVLGLFPLIWGGLADRYGRKWVLVISTVIFLTSNIGAALASSIQILIAMRVFQGIGSSAPLVVGVGIVSDVFPKEELGMSVSIFFSGTLIGPIIGPIIGGLLDDRFGWRSTFWLLSIIALLIIIFLLAFLPETLYPRQSFPVKVTIFPPSITKVGRLFNPLSSLIYLKFPVVILAGLVPALAFGTFFGIESFHSRAMGGVYLLTSTSKGLSFLVLGVGSVLGNFVGGKLSDIMSQRSKNSSNLEARLHGVWVFALILVLGLLSYGWSLELKLNIWVPLIATFFIGFGYTACSIGASAYLVDLAPDFASSITSCANLLKMALATLLTALNTLIIENLGYGFGSTIFAVLASLAVIITLILVISGYRIRKATGPFPHKKQIH